MSSFEERVHKVRAEDARLSSDRDDLARQKAQRESEHESKRVDLRRIWVKVTEAMVQTGQEPDVLVATPEGIARARSVPNREPSFFQQFRHNSSKAVQKHASKQYAAVGSLYQPAWDMQTSMTTGKGTELEQTTEFFLAQDATVYTGLAKSGNFKSPDGFELPYYEPFYPIDEYMDLGDLECDTIEQGLARLVVRRELAL